MRPVNRTRVVYPLLAAVASALFVMPARADWPVFDHDSARSGFAAGDATITLGNVGGLHKRWVSKYDAAADGAPIILDDVNVGGKTEAVLFQETLAGTTYAVVAHTGALLWKNTTSGPKITNSMPAADPSGRWIYAPGVDAHVHKLAVATGHEVTGGGFPLRVTWSPNIEKDGTALNIANGFLYAAVGGYDGDGGQYDGHTIAVDLSTGHVNVVNSLCYRIHHLIQTPGTCGQARSGIWARGGVVVDPDPNMGGQVYVATGNGDFDANTGGDDFGDSVLAISADGSAIVDSFTPTDFNQLDRGDIDLGSVAPVMLPRQPSSNTPLMAVQWGKDGILKLLNRKHLGGVGGELQDYNLNDTFAGAPAVWVDGGGTTWLYCGTRTALYAFTLVTNNGVSKLKPAWSDAIGSTSPIVVNGIIFAATSGTVRAINALTGGFVWSTTRASAGGTIANVHWESPVVDRGWLYISDQSGAITAYSL